MTGRIVQGISEDQPFTRMAGGELAVYCRYAKPSIQTAPVQPADGPIRKPGDVRPGPLQPNRWRISNALDARSLYGPEVDEALGVHGVDLAGAPYDAGVVDAWEAGTIVPSELEVRRLATLTGYPPAFFYQDDPPMVGHGFMCVRSGTPGLKKGCYPL